ncbi:hypothetical protein N9B82_02700 [Saprospiraceae bacterium]|nr:hypothetical protein [Saprospiraceae bacterium]
MEYIIKNKNYYIAAFTIGIILCMLIPNSTPIGIIAAWVLGEFKRYFDFQQTLKDDDSKLTNSEKTVSQEPSSENPWKKRDVSKMLKYLVLGLLSLLLVPFLFWIIVNLYLYFTNS